MEFIGRSILIGLTYCDKEGNVVNRIQFLGKIVEANEERILVDSPEGKQYVIPPVYEGLLNAPRGEYKCLISNEAVVDPDYLMSWKITLSADPANEPQEWEANGSPHFFSIVPAEWEFSYRQDEEYLQRLIETKADEYIGKHVLIGLVHYEQVDGEEKLIRMEQIHGKIIRVSYNEGVVVELGGGREHKLPPDLSMLQPAPGGEYNLHPSGETIEDPNYITTWDVSKEGDAQDGD